MVGDIASDDEHRLRGQVNASSNTYFLQCHCKQWQDGEAQICTLHSQAWTNGPNIPNRGNQPLNLLEKNTTRDVREVLEGVVENGTAKNLRNSNYKIAGVKQERLRLQGGVSGYRGDSGVSHQASFVGYFPAEGPKILLYCGG